MTQDKDHIKEQVREAYNAIAPHFSRTRERIWPPTEIFLQDVAPCTIADIGCGTGRALSRGVELECEVYGIDSSKEQLTQSERRLERDGANGEYYQLVLADMERIPFDDGSIDNCIMIASIHHLPTRERRVQALKEALRITGSGGIIQVSAWTWDQDRFRQDHLSRVEKKREAGPLDGPLPGDFLVPWKEGVERLRFYHLYGPGELEGELNESGWKPIRSYFDGRNHWVEGIKV